MDLIQRPKEVPRSQKNYLDDKKYQEYSGQQFENIYDYLDGTSNEINSLNPVAKSGDYNDLTNKLEAGTGVIVNSNNEICEDVTELFNEPTGSTSVTLSEAVTNFYKIRVFYKLSRESKTFYGNIELYDVNDVYFTIQGVTKENGGNGCAFSQGTYLMKDSSISLSNSNVWSFGSGTAISMNTNNVTSIVRVEGINRK